MDSCSCSMLPASCFLIFLVLLPPGPASNASSCFLLVLVLVLLLHPPCSAILVPPSSFTIPLLVLVLPSSFLLPAPSTSTLPRHPHAPCSQLPIPPSLVLLLLPAAMVHWSHWSTERRIWQSWSCLHFLDHSLDVRQDPCNLSKLAVAS